MAGMLPGVECARRRRLHQGGDSPAAATHGWTRRSSFCLYTSNHESHHAATSSLRIVLNEALVDEKLGAKAREAKERLDERLKIQKRSKTRRHNSSVNPRGVDSRGSIAPGEFQTEVFSSKKSGSKRFSWAKLSWKASEQDECTICLERFDAGEHLVHLPCAHRYHAKCLVPWLENSSHCPCCRMEISV